MELQHYTYAGLLFLVMIVPLVLSFDKNVQFYTRWKYLFPAIIITGAVFILWDIKFTEASIWSFNPSYTTGINFKGLPVEEWLFFLVIPYACLFIYETLKFYLPKLEYNNVFAAISLALIVLFGVLSYFHRTQLYTFFNFMFAAIYLGYTIFRNRFKQHLTKFYGMYLISLIPFLLVNGVLTGLPVVDYNPYHIMGIHVFTIPVEDFGYLFLLLLMNTTIYEILKTGKYF